ncbi:MAG: aldo/keto reductase [Phycisphaeraceae bacterium]|nr:aldo/keto reductase [Phycisphaeraceae bacterium]
MKKTPLGKTGLQVTALGFGGAEIGYLATDKARVSSILNLLLDEWVNVIDTAASYHGSEELIGQTISHRRGEYVLISKCGGSVPQVEGEPWSEKLITQTIDRSLQRLKVNRLDVMLLHSCDLKVLRQGEAVGALVKAREAGKIRFAGYSGDNEAAAYAATLPDIAVIETSINIADQANIDLVLPAARKHNVGIIAKRPLANAPWRSDHSGVYAGYVKTYKERFTAMGLNLADLGYAKVKPESAWPGIALRFTLSFPEVNTAIIGTTNPVNAKANVEAAEKGSLDPEAVTKIRAAFADAQRQSGQTWTGQT